MLKDTTTSDEDIRKGSDEESVPVESSERVDEEGEDYSNGKGTKDFIL